jgi:hypothetical protein
MAEATTADEAVRGVREQNEAALAASVRLVLINVPQVREHPSARFRGNWSQVDPVIQRWKQYVEEYRQQIEGDPNIP